MNRRSIAFITIFSLLLLNPSPEAQAAAKAGAKCTRAGITSVVSGKTLTCIKSGKNLIWKQVVSKSKTAPSTASADAQPKKASNDVADYITFPVLQTLGKNITDITWGNYQIEKSKSINTAPVQFSVSIGSNTTVDNKNVLKDLEFASRFFHRIKQPEKVQVYQYGFEDVSWVMDQIKSKIIPALQQSDGFKWSELTIKSNCQSAQSCNGASAFKIGDQGFIYIANSPRNLDKYHKTGAIAVHEYIHLLQMEEQNAQKSEQQGSNGQAIASWYQEGMAHYLGALLNSPSKKDFEILRAELTNRRSFNGEITQNSILEFMNDQILPNYDRKNFLASYSAGMLMVEALNAVIGIEGLFSVYKDHGRTNNFSNSFEMVFGLSLATISPIIASAAYKFWEGN